MCFSPEADVVAAVVIGAVGVDAARHTGRAAQWPLAALPLLLAGHTLDEAFIWWGLRGEVSHAVQTVTTAIYLAIAMVILPVYVPVTVLLLERARRRRPAQIAALVAGILCAAGLAAALVTGPVSTRAVGHHIVYYVHVRMGDALIALYLVSTCGALLLSGRRFLRWYGAANAAAVAVLAWIATEAVTSLWCAWAAVTSIGIAVYLRSTGPTRHGHAPATAT
jgi:hypothetical protein